MGVETPTGTYVRPGAGEAGFSLIEVVVAIGLFGLISLAGFALLSSILNVRNGTEGRLERLGEVQRALHLITSDFQQMRGKSLRVDSTGASFDRAGSDVTGSISVRYDAVSGQLMRSLSGRASASGSGGGSGSAAQVLIGGLAAARWTVYLPEAGWIEEWPRAGVEADGAQPLAIAVELDLDGQAKGLSGSLRRIVELPAAP